MLKLRFKTEKNALIYVWDKDKDWYIYIYIYILTFKDYIYTIVK